MNRQVYIAPRTDRIQVAMEQGFMVTSKEAAIKVEDDKPIEVEKYERFDMEITFD